MTLVLNWFVQLYLRLKEEIFFDKKKLDCYESKEIQ